MESNLLQNAYSLATNHNQNELSRYQNDQNYKPNYKTVEDFLVTSKIKESKPRTLAQNSALHLYFEMLAEALGEAGLDMRKTLKPNIDIPWSKETVKEYLFRPIMKSQLNKKSTIEMTTKEVDQVIETLNRHLGEKFGLHIPFPSIDSIMDRELLKDQESLAEDYS